MKELWKYKSLLYELVSRDIKIKYRRSILGVLWTVLNPLLMMMILYLVFSKLFRFDIENYAIYILSGQVIFNYYQTATTDCMMAILGNGSLIRKVYLPKYMLVLAKILSGAVNLFASFIALLVVMLLTNEKLSFTLVWAVFPFVCLILLSFGVGFFLSAIAVRFRDVLHLYSVFCTALFYLTPVIYPFSILPEYIKDIVSYNPITRILESFRMIIIENAVPNSADMAYCFLAAVVIWAAGAMVFHRRQQKFILDL